MANDLDYIALFAMTKNFNIKPRTIFVEGVTDVALIQLAAQLEKDHSGNDYLGDRLAIIAAGDGNDGGAKGICRELVCFKNMAKGCLLPNGTPKYRFIGLFDNDNAGRQAVHDIRKTDTSILEFKDVFRLWPIMPQLTNRDPDVLRNKFERENNRYKKLDWELEDLLPDTLIDYFLSDHPDAIIRDTPVGDKIHRDWTSDGKAKLHRFVKQNAIHSDLITIINLLRAFWGYLGIQIPIEK